MGDKQQGGGGSGRLGRDDINRDLRDSTKEFLEEGIMGKN